MGTTVIIVPVFYTEEFTEDELIEMVLDCNEGFVRLLRMLIQLPVWPDQLTLRGLKRAKRLAERLEKYEYDSDSDDEYFNADYQGLAGDCDELIRRIDAALSHGQGLSVPDIMKLQLIRAFFQDYYEDSPFITLVAALDQAIETVEENIKEASK